MKLGEGNVKVMKKIIVVRREVRGPGVDRVQERKFKMKPSYRFGLAAAVVFGAGVVAADVHALENGPYCREYTQKVTIGGRVREAYGTACLQDNGAWQIVSQEVEGEPVAVSAPLQTVAVSQPVQYVEQPVFVASPRYYDPAPWPFFVSFGYSSFDGGWRGGHGGGWHGGHGGWHH